MVEVLIIRPEKEIGMGCCGGICDDEDGLVSMKDAFNHHKEDRENLGNLYNKTRDKYGNEVSVTFVDPRNLLAISVYFVKRIRNRHISLAEAIKHILLDIKYNAVFVDGTRTDNLSNYDQLIQERLYQYER
ncbi:hypothetical protein Q7A53_15495 [Halobacillus rhizosphaerae]|uniref:hypothetical protein n=1 Tax=Halobacillus rhizosphaerae TaxID=3064889 RepID=UPI00398B7CB4